MAITIQCQCSRVITVSDELAGQPTRCPSCGRRHLIPQLPARAPAPVTRKVDLSGERCRDCRGELIAGATFCHCCGLPMQPAEAQRVQVQLPPSVPAMQPVMAFPPHVVPVPPSQQQMAGPFAAPVGHAPLFASPPPAAPAPVAAPATPAPRNACCGPFSNAMQQRAADTRPVSGLGRVAMTCAYMGILLGLFAGLVSLPLTGHLAWGQELQIKQGHSLIRLANGMGILMVFFSFVGVLSGFLGLFHLGRKRGAAVAGLILSAVVGMSAVVGIGLMHKRWNAVHPEAPVKSIIKRGQRGGCCGFRSQPQERIAPVEQQPATPRFRVEQQPAGPEAAPVKPAPHSQNEAEQY